MRILALSPHPDDIELGCGGFLANHSSDKIKVIHFSDCAESLKELPEDTLINESKESSLLLGFVSTVLDYKVRRFSEKRQDILEMLTYYNISYNPDLVLIPSASDVHQDHKVIYEEALRAFKFTNMLAYELPRNCRSFNPNYFCELNDLAVEKKIKMIKFYKSQVTLGRNYFDEEQIRANLRFRGSQINTKYAEAFEVITLKDIL